MLPDYANVIKSFEMTLISKHRTEKLKIIGTETLKTYFYNKIENAHLYKPVLSKTIATNE